MAFIARKDGICDGCAGIITATVSPIKWSRKNPALRGKFFHAECFPTGNVPESDSEPETNRETETTTPNISVAHNSLDNFSLAQVMAGALQPFITANSDDIDARISKAIDAAMASVKPTIHTQTIVVKDGETIGKVDGIQHKLFPVLVRMIAMRQATYLWGEAGSGKSTAAHKASDLLGLPFYYLALQAQTTESKLMGYMDANGRYVESDFFKAYTQGGVFLLDELELGNGNLLGSLNGALANGLASFPCGIQKRHPDFVCIATGNTPALGATEAYCDRRALDGAVRDRFAFIEWNTDLDLEVAAAIANFADAAKWVAWVQATRLAAKRISPRLIVTQRASVAGAKMLANGFAPAEVAEMLVFRGFDSNSVASILHANPLPTY